MGDLINSVDSSNSVRKNTSSVQEKNPNRVLYVLVGILLVALVCGGAGLYFMQQSSTNSMTSTSDSATNTKTADTATVKKAAADLSIELTSAASDITDITNDTSITNTDDTVPTL